MTVPLAVVVTLLLMVGVNVWVHVGPPAGSPSPGRSPRSCCCWWALGRPVLGAAGPRARVGACAGLVWGGAAVGPRRRWCTPSGWRCRRLARALPRRAAPGRGAVAGGRPALLVVPLGVVVFEEVAFRGVLWGLVDVGPRRACGRPAHLGALRAVARAARRRRGSGQRGATRHRVRRARTSCGRWPARSRSPPLAGVVFAVLRDAERQPARTVPAALGDQRARHPRGGLGVERAAD